MRPIGTDVHATATGTAPHRRWMLAHSAALAAAYWVIGLTATALFPLAGGAAVLCPRPGGARAALIAWGPRVAAGVVVGSLAVGLSAGLGAGAVLASTALVTGECLFGW